MIYDLWMFLFCHPEHREGSGNIKWMYTDFSNVVLNNTSSFLRSSE